MLPVRIKAVYGESWERDETQLHTFYRRLRKVEPLEPEPKLLEPKPHALFSGIMFPQENPSQCCDCWKLDSRKTDSRPYRYRNSQFIMLADLKCLPPH